MKVNDLSSITISDEDIVVLLSNLLNNAIEACEKSKEKMLKMKFVIEDNQIILSVKNSIADMPVRIDGELVSTKKDQEESHGIGLKNITEVIENDDRNTCLFDELYDDLIDRIRWTIQCIWSILYCEAIDDTFLISKWNDWLLLNWEAIDKKDYDAFEYFYDLMFVW